MLYSFSLELEFLDLARLVAGEHGDVDAASVQCSRRFDRPRSPKQSFTKLGRRLQSAYAGRTAKTVRFSKADIDIDHMCLSQPGNGHDQRHCLYFKVGDVLKFFRVRATAHRNATLQGENGGGCLQAIARRS